MRYWWIRKTIEDEKEQKEFAQFLAVHRFNKDVLNFSNGDTFYLNFLHLIDKFDEAYIVVSEKEWKIMNYFVGRYFNNNILQQTLKLSTKSNNISYEPMFFENGRSKLIYIFTNQEIEVVFDGWELVYH